MSPINQKPWTDFVGDIVLEKSMGSRMNAAANAVSTLAELLSAQSLERLLDEEEEGRHKFDLPLGRHESGLLSALRVCADSLASDMSALCTRAALASKKPKGGEA